MLGLYRRHRQNCKGRHAHNTRTSEYDERKKGWDRCECPIFVSGSLSQICKRQNTAVWEWVDARAVAAEWEQRGSWDGLISQPPQPEQVPTKDAQRITITDATEA